MKGLQVLLSQRR